MLIITALVALSVVGCTAPIDGTTEVYVGTLSHPLSRDVPDESGVMLELVRGDEFVIRDCVVPIDANGELEERAGCAHGEIVSASVSDIGTTGEAIAVDVWVRSNGGLSEWSYLGERVR